MNIDPDKGDVRLHTDRRGEGGGGGGKIRGDFSMGILDYHFFFFFCFFLEEIRRKKVKLIVKEKNLIRGYRSRVQPRFKK